MNILLHICCAPCAIYPIEELKAEGRRIAGYFYNPNIHPYSEYLKRKAEVEKYSAQTGINVIYSDYEIADYFQHIFCFAKQIEPSVLLRRNNPPKPYPSLFVDGRRRIVYNEALKNRCPVCWWLRMAKTARFASENNFDAFTTTLLVSPYQGQDMIKRIGEEVAAKFEKLNFYYKDFRPGFRKSHDKAKAKGIYCQKYCGCIFSEVERIEKKGHRDEACLS